MKSLSRVFSQVNINVNNTGFERLFLRHKGLKVLSCGHIQHQKIHSKLEKIQKGPSLKDFLIKEQVKQISDAESEITENVPYLEKSILDGQGQKVYFEVHGCQMNENDIEVVWSILSSHGYGKTTKLMEADIVLIMTCAIRDTAESKIWKKLIDLKNFKLRTQKINMKVGILGCMAERLKNKIIEVDKTVDVVAGPDSYKDLPRLLAVTRGGQKAVNVLLSLDETYADVMPVRLNENQATAYVSIMRGCDNMCTYCIVPFTRGKERSRSCDSILDEVRMLSEQGIKQVTLLGQNVNSYRDITSGSVEESTKLAAGFKTVYKTKKGGLRFDALLDKVSEIDPNMRIRFTSPHPKDFPDEVLHLINERKNICCNLHLPAQSGSNTVLERMRRGYTREAYLDLVDRVRSIVPGVTLSTDMIVGFCGETEQDHQDTLDLIRKVRYNFIYFFPYSMRQKTTAHRRYNDDVPQNVKISRVKDVQNLFWEISEEINQSLIGQTHLVLIDDYYKKSKETFQGRTDGNTRILIPSCSVPVSPDSTEVRPIQIGDYVAVNFTKGFSHGMAGVPLYITSLVDYKEPQDLSQSQTAVI